MTLIRLTNEATAGGIATGEVDVDINRWISAVKDDETFSNNDAHTQKETHLQT